MSYIAAGPVSSLPTMSDFRQLAEAYSNITVRELTTGTTGIALAQLVATRAAIQLLTLVDARNFCRVELVPERGGKTYHFQRVVTATGGQLTEGTDLSATDTTLADVAVTLQVNAIRTDISDLLQRQGAINFAETVGIAHGNSMNREINNDIYTVLKGNTTSVVSVSGAGEQDFAWSDLFTARDLVERQRGRPDTYVSGSKKFYAFIRNNITAVQFTAALADYLKSGAKPNLIGLTPYVDAVYGDTYAGTAGEEYAHILQAGEAEGYAQAWDIMSELQRWAPQVGFRLVTSQVGKPGLVLEVFTASIQHA